MANNEENIERANRERTSEEARENGRKGGIASGKARREKADLRKAVQAALDGEYKTKDGQTISGSDLLVKSLMTIAGNPKNKGAAVMAFKTMATMLGQDLPEAASDDDDQVRKFLKAMRGD